MHPLDAKKLTIGQSVKRRFSLQQKFRVCVLLGCVSDRATAPCIPFWKANGNVALLTGEDSNLRLKTWGTTTVGSAFWERRTEKYGTSFAEEDRGRRDAVWVNPVLRSLLFNALLLEHCYDHYLSS